MSKPAIPSSWAFTKLGKVTEYGRVNKAEPNEIEDSAWVLELEDIEKNTSKLLARVSFANRQSKSTKNRFEPGDVLYGKLRPYLNKVIIADNPGYCTTEIIPLKAGQHLDNRYLFYWLKHPTFLDYVEAESHGLNMPRLGTDTGRAAPFILAPFNEQKRIADKLDAVLARVDACRDRLDRIPAILKRFRQSVLAAATSGKLTEEWRTINKINETVKSVMFEEDQIVIPFAWSVLSIKDVIDSSRPLCYGVVQPGEEKTGGIPLIRVQDMDRGGVLTEKLRTVSIDIDAEYKRSRVVSGDLLVSVVGTIGRTAIVPRGLEANIARAIARIACNTEILNGKWLNIWLSTDTLQWWLSKSSKEVARKTLNLSDLATTKIALPSLEEQTEIVRRVESLFAYADRLEARYTTARGQVEKLTPALLAKAFRGELVPQDPNDEPASEFLARIRAARKTDKPKKVRQLTTRKRARAPKENSTMTKSRQDDDVKNQPYLAGHLRLLEGSATVEALFKASELPVADFYKQLAWEVEQGFVKDNKTALEAADAA